MESTPLDVLVVCFCLQPLNTTDGVFVLGKLSSYFVDNFALVAEEESPERSQSQSKKRDPAALLAGLRGGIKKSVSKSVVAVPAAEESSGGVWLSSSAEYYTDFGYCGKSVREKDWRCRKRGTQAM